MTRRELLRLFSAALADLDLASRVAAALPRSPPRGAAARVIAIGKAAPAMAEGALARWSDDVERCLVVVTDGTDAAPVSRTFADAVVLRAGHPLPDRRSLRAGRACLELARARRGEPGVLLVLVSGGASALVSAPIEGVTLSMERAVTSAMLASGAPVQAVNVVRKHLSRIKGGGLARAAHPDEVMTIVASDVVGGSPSDVGSGPSLPDRTSVADARRALRAYAPRYASVPLARTFGAGFVGDDAARHRAASRRSRRSFLERAWCEIVASPEQLAGAISDRLRAFGVAARVLASTQGRVTTLAQMYAGLARTMRPGTAIVRAAEPSLTLMLPRPGRGGRSTHLAALVGRDLPPGALFASFATDGVDGASGTGGAIVGAGFASREAIERALARFDTGPLHRRAGTALPARPTGHNLADLHVLVAPPRSP